MIIVAISISIIDLMVIIMIQASLLGHDINHQMDDYYQLPYDETKAQDNQFKTTCYVIIIFAIIFMGVIWWFNETYLMHSILNWVGGIISIIAALILTKNGYHWLDKITDVSNSK